LHGKEKGGAYEAAHGMQRAVVQEELSLVLFLDAKYRLNVTGGGARALAGWRAPGHFNLPPVRRRAEPFAQ
jgi:hypothetical protein